MNPFIQSDAATDLAQAITSDAVKRNSFVAIQKESRFGVISEELRERIEDAYLPTLSRLSGITSDTISRLLSSNTRNPLRATVEKLVAALDSPEMSYSATESIKARLAGRNLSQVSRVASVSKASVCSLARGKYANPFAGTIEKVSAALDAIDTDPSQGYLPGPRRKI